MAIRILNPAIEIDPILFLGQGEASGEAGKVFGVNPPPQESGR